MEMEDGVLSFFNAPLGIDKFIRLSSELTETDNQLGPLADLAGTWFGSKGWNLIAVPNGPKGFSLLVAPIIETMTFTPIGAEVPNRGGAAGTQLIPGLHYTLSVCNAETNQPMHIENGMWLLLSDPKDPSAEKQVCRLATVPHGNSLLATGSFFTKDGAPEIPPNSAMPTTGQPVPLGYLDPYLNMGTPGFNAQNTNQTLVDTLKGQNVVSTTTLLVNTENPGGGILNIPFITKNADCPRMHSEFWIETVIDASTGGTFQQLQYSQTVDLEFLPRFDDPTKKIIWPHVTVNTLVKQ